MKNLMRFKYWPLRNNGTKNNAKGVIMFAKKLLALAGLIVCVAGVYGLAWLLNA